MSKVDVEKLDEHIRPILQSKVRVKETGDVLEVRYSTHQRGAAIRKLNSDEYEDRFGEIHQFNKNATTRADNLMTVKKSLANLRDIINCNTTHPDRCIWLTLTYKENMKDTKKLYSDFDKFMKRLRYYLLSNNLPKVDYICAVEPQARGAWHVHGVLLFERKAPFIPNDKMGKIWGHGFTKTKSLKNITNAGLYLTAYLADMDFEEAMKLGKIKGDGIKEVATIDESGKPTTKAIIKGARLRLYPAHMQIFRCSRGVKRPKIFECREAEAQKMIGNAPLTYERTVKISEEDHIYNVINYRQFNKKGLYKQNNSTDEK